MKNNSVAKYAARCNRSLPMKDRKKAFKRGDRKHRKPYASFCDSMPGHN